MRRRLEAFERRLARLTRFFRAAAEAAERERSFYEARQTISAFIREGLRRAGIDPAEAVTLRRYEAIEPPPPAPPVWRPPDARERLIAEMERLAERMRGHPPNLASASPAMLLAYYVFGEGAREAPA